MTLTKDDLVKTLVKENGYTVNQTIEVVETLLEIIKSKLVSGEDVLISGFRKILRQGEAGEAREESSDR